jgi:hypothetical protein
MLVSKYLNQSCQLTVRNTDPKKYDRYGKPLVEEVKTIRCRIEDTVVDVQTSAGVIKKSQTIYFLDQKPADVDLIDGKPILRITAWVDFMGKPQGYKVIV